MSCPVYRAEDRAWANQGGSFTLEIDDPQPWVDWVTSQAPFTTLRQKAGLPGFYVSVTVACAPQAALAQANAKFAHITIARGVRATQGLLLHELAHLCSPVDAHHDFRFCGNYLQLVRYWLGEVAGTTLLRAMREARAFP